MNHDDARRAVSERMDGDRLSSRTSAALDRHLVSCAPCRAFESGAWRLREAARFGVAERVPDLVEPIMRAVRADAASGRSVRARLRRRRFGTLGAVAASLVVGLVAGSLTVGGPWHAEEQTTLASAADVSASVAAAASRVRAYQATFTVTERDPAGPAKRRTLSMNVAFRAPEQFRLDVADHTPGAGTRFAANDLELIVNGASSYQVAPSACPIGVCPASEQVVRNRLPFSSATPAPTDLVVPVATLVGAREMQVVRTGRVLGRRAIEVRLPFEGARRLFPFLDLGGRWRPFFPGDRVELWLDARSWFPLRYTVYPAVGPNRDEWQLRFGIKDEPAGVPIFQVQAVSIDQTAPSPSTFRIPHVRSATDEGARAATIDEIRRTVRFAPVAPTRVDGLPLYRAVLPQSERDDAVLTYSSGLSWLKLGETHVSTGDRFFGPVGVHAQQVEIDGVGTAYYAPASDRHGRRLAIHTADGRDLYLETNLSREQLLGAAASLDVRAAPLPAPWLTNTSPLGTTRRVTLDEAAAALPFAVLVPTPPAGYSLASVETVTVSGATSINLYFLQEDGADAGPLRLHEEAATALPPGSAPREYAITVRGVAGRWSPGRNQLEWVEDGVYYSLDGAGLELADLLQVAASMRPANATPTSAPALGSSATPASASPSVP
ncbi:MAG: zf-HC2 domain-containing protein [Actinomycetota bacterium]